MHAQTSGWIWVKLCMQGPYYLGQLIRGTSWDNFTCRHTIYLSGGSGRNGAPTPPVLISIFNLTTFANLNRHAAQIFPGNASQLVILYKHFHIGRNFCFSRDVANPFVLPFQARTWGFKDCTLNSKNSSSTRTKDKRIQDQNDFLA